MWKISKNVCATIMVCLAVVSTIFFVWKMVELHGDSEASRNEVILAEPEVETAATESVEELSVFQNAQVIREIELGMSFDMEHGVMVRNLSTNEIARMTEPGIETRSDSGAGYSYAIEERMDGGADILVSLRTEPKTNYLVSYQVMDNSTGVKQITNVTVVDGTVTAENTFFSEDLTASTID